MAIMAGLSAFIRTLENVGLSYFFFTSTVLGVASRGTLTRRCVRRKISVSITLRSPLIAYKSFKWRCFVIFDINIHEVFYLIRRILYAYSTV